MWWESVLDQHNAFLGIVVYDIIMEISLRDCWQTPANMTSDVCVFAWWCENRYERLHMYELQQPTQTIEWINNDS